MGEFGAVSVVSGHIRGLTNTIPLQVEILYNEYSIAAAFSLASLLALPGPGHARTQDLFRAPPRRRRSSTVTSPGRRSSSPRLPRGRSATAFGAPRAISIRGLSKTFGASVILDRVDLDIAPGELLALLGPSGSGKTTLLRLLAGLDTASAGAIEFDGEDAARTSVQERRVGFVFQSYALFRHMSVFDNIAYGLDGPSPPRAPVAAGHCASACRRCWT